MKRLVLVVLVEGICACASASGYDPSRYAQTPQEAASVDPETTPLTHGPAPRLVDPRSPLDASR